MARDGELERALKRVFISADQADSNLVDAVFALARAVDSGLWHLGHGAPDPSGAIDALTGAVQLGAHSIADALRDVAGALNRLADLEYQRHGKAEGAGPPAAREDPA
jgi:hypothetical protein